MENDSLLPGCSLSTCSLSPGFDCKYFYCAQPSFDRIFHSVAFRKMIDLYLLLVFNCDAFLFPEIIIMDYEVIWSFNFSISCKYIPYARLYNPRFVYFLPTFRSPKTFFQGAFFLKFWPYVWLVFKSGF